MPAKQKFEFAEVTMSYNHPKNKPCYICLVFKAAKLHSQQLFPYKKATAISSDPTNRKTQTRRGKYEHN
jgi:hypothetical protein